MGVYVCTGELELVTPGQKVYGAGMGMGYRFPGAWSSTHWSDVSTILMKGEGQKRLRTRIKEALQKNLLPSRMEQKCFVQVFLTTPEGTVFFINTIVKYYYDNVHNLGVLWKSCSMAN